MRWTSISWPWNRGELLKEFKFKNRNHGMSKRHKIYFDWNTIRWKIHPKAILEVEQKVLQTFGCKVIFLPVWNLKFMWRWIYRLWVFCVVTPTGSHGVTAKITVDCGSSSDAATVLRLLLPVSITVIIQFPDFKCGRSLWIGTSEQICLCILHTVQ